MAKVPWDPVPCPGGLPQHTCPTGRTVHPTLTGNSPGPPPPLPSDSSHPAGPGHPEPTRPESTAPSSATGHLPRCCWTFQAVLGGAITGLSAPLPSPSGTGQVPRWPPGGAFPRASSPASPLVPVISSRILDGPGPAPGVGHPSLSSASGPSSTSLTSGPKAQRGRQLWGGCGTGAVHPPTAPTVRVLEMLNSALRASVWPLTWAPWPSAPRVGGAPATTACPHPALYPLPSAPCPQHIVCHKCQEPGAKCRASYSPG